MPLHMTRTQRVHAMIRMLRQHPYSVSALADIFGVCPRAIQADLRLIQQDPFWLTVQRETVVRVLE